LILGPANGWRAAQSVSCSADLQPKLNHQVLHRQRLERFGMDEPRRVTTDALKLMEHALYETGTIAGWALGHRYQTAHKGGAIALFHHF
jgi:hypothetical protein